MKNYRCVFFISMCLMLTSLLTGCDLTLLNPKGLIAAEEKQLLLISTGLMLIVVVPVIFLTLFFAFRYREKNTQATYSPNWAHNYLLEVVCWFIPCIIVILLAVITWKSSHKLDPYRPLDSKQKPLVVQVISLEWKWLFIYPEQGIATINYIQIPKDRPIRFEITAEGPMNSFLIPALGGQIYAMAGMVTKLHLIADTEGEYKGIAANFTGDGFSDMKFKVYVTSEAAFTDWVKVAKQSPLVLTQAGYQSLVKRSEQDAMAAFSSVPANLFANVSMKGMMPMTQNGMDHTSHHSVEGNQL